MGGVSQQERWARAVLTVLAEPGDRVVGLALQHSSAVDLVGRVRHGAEPEFAHLVPRLESADADRDLELLASVGGRFVVPGDLEWPTQLDALGWRRPWGLWVRGPADLRLSALRSAAVVGARAATAYGVHMASLIASELSAGGWAVVQNYRQSTSIVCGILGSIPSEGILFIAP